MERKYYSFAEAMNIVGNGGFVGRETYPDDEFIGLDEEGDVAIFSCQGDDFYDFEVFVPTVEDIKAEDWYLKDKPKDNRTEDEITFDEEMLSIKESLEVMGELVVDKERYAMYHKLMDAIGLDESDLNREDEEEISMMEGNIEALEMLKDLLNTYVALP